ncbi:tumor necrosis factor receptor superfamily member 16-like isoform X2 [Pristis pectinata]|uniref:tumor necrosis factor receptor superfamily member 16-like isoform X2 n=1 Tax=Pristis pectinata TaxID=685728 RepID=UPI00223C9CDB|nr:tumor necrosis factor receptor superfamily member 16-like isoform X2 [Pristis pectinata]
MSDGCGRGGDDGSSQPTSDKLQKMTSMKVRRVQPTSAVLVQEQSISAFDIQLPNWGNGDGIKGSVQIVQCSVPEPGRWKSPVSFTLTGVRMRTAPFLLLFAAVSVCKGQESCESGQYTSDGKCCSVCPPGEGVLTPCGDKDTVCTTCLDTNRHPRPTVVSTVIPPKIVTTTEIMTTTAVPSSPQFIGQGNTDNIIPVYCSILAAVVVGLVAYVAFKRWNSCKQNKQGANNRTVNETQSPEGEKLHSDSGISVDSQSLHEQQQKQQQQKQQQQQQQSQATRVEPSLYNTLPPHKQEEVEQLLNTCEEESEWCNLAGLLGYSEEHIDTFKQDEHPVRALLSDWSAKDCATTDALCTALRKLKRDDIVESLSNEPTAMSVV